jgi:predicted enzyme related to lactoylglutathione lyase
MPDIRYDGWSCDEDRSEGVAMTAGLSTIIYPVKDLAKAKELYAKLLGVDPDVDEAYYVNFTVKDQTVGLDPNGHSQGLTGAVGYWTVDDIASTFATLVENGASEVQPIRDVGGGKLVASLKDADGNMIGLMQSP